MHSVPDRSQVPWLAQGQADDPKPKSGTVLRVDLNLGRYGTGMDRLGFEPRTSCLQSRRSSADLPAPTRAQRRGADETFRDNSPVQRGSTLILSAQMTEPWVPARTKWYAGSSGLASWAVGSSSWRVRFS